MITITVKKRQGQYEGFISRGHAGYAEAGYDIVCAAVSTLTITTVNSIEKFTEDKIRVKSDDGLLVLQFMDTPSERAGLLMDSLVLGLTQIENSYQKHYLRVKIREV